jgi:hypothetical protein
MRIRQVKPAFWTDSTIAGLPPAVRLFYIGLWMLADDAGYLRFDTPQIANELYGYESRKKREREVDAFANSLIEEGRVVLYGCGHAFIPHLTDHQRLSGETHRVVSVKREHEGCTRSPASPRTSPLVPDTVRNGRGTVGNVKERNGTPRAGEPDGPLAEISEFREKAKWPA